MKKLILPVLAAAVLATGCAASSDASSGSGERMEGTTLTGSRLKRTPDENYQGVRTTERDKYDPHATTGIERNRPLPSGN